METTSMTENEGLNLGQDQNTGLHHEKSSQESESVDAEAERNGKASATGETKTMEGGLKTNQSLRLMSQTSATPCASQDVELLPQNLIRVSDLKRHIDGEGNLDIVWEGKVFLCRTVKDTRKSTGIQCVVTDLDGENKLGLLLYNYSLCGASEGAVLNHVVPIGTIFAVKNPCFKSTESDGLILRAGDPSRIELLSMKRLEVLFPGLEWTGTYQPQPNAFDWSKSDVEVGSMLKAVGNCSFKDKRWTDALRFYDMALDYLTEGTEHFNIMNNKAAAYLNIGCFNLSLKFAQIVLDQDGDNLKAISRKAKALFGLAKYSTSLDFLNGKLYQNTIGNACGDGGADLRKLHQLACDLLEQKCNGDISDPVLYSLVLSYLDYDTARSDTSAIPQLKGPLEIAFIEGKQRFIATEDIDPGRILFSYKPFAYVSKLADPCPPPDYPNLGGESIRAKDLDELVTQIANKISLDPELGKDVYKLGSVRENENGQNLNHAELEDDEEILRKVDVCRIRAIVKENFSSFILAEKQQGLRQNSGLWLYGQKAFLARSCSEVNANFICFNEMLVLRAVKEIKKGAEIALPTEVPVDFVGDRAEAMKTHSPEGVCKCPLCVLEASEAPSIVEERKEIFSWLRKEVGGAQGLRLSFMHHPRTLDTAVDKIHRLLEMRKDAPHLNPCLGSSEVLNLHWALFEQERFEECEALGEKIFVGLEYMASKQKVVFRMLPGQIDCCIALRKEEKLGELIKKMKSLVKAHYGTSREDVMRKLVPKSTFKDLKEKMNIDFFSYS